MAASAAHTKCEPRSGADQISHFVMIFTISAFSRAMISFAVPAGAAMPCQAAQYS
jgi:hypothetical protein